MQTWRYAVQTTNGRRCEYESPHHPIYYAAAQEAAVKAEELGGKALGARVSLVRETYEGVWVDEKLGNLTTIHKGEAYAIT